MNEYYKHLSEPWFTLIKLGIKTCEGRLKKGDFSNMNKGDVIYFNNDDFGFNRVICCRITSIHYYDTFEAYLRGESLHNCLPGVDTLEEGVNTYYKYYSPKQEETYKIVAIRLKIKD